MGCTSSSLKKGVAATTAPIQQDAAPPTAAHTLPAPMLPAQTITTRVVSEAEPLQPLQPRPRLPPLAMANSLDSKRLKLPPFKGVRSPNLLGPVLGKPEDKENVSANLVTPRASAEGPLGELPGIAQDKPRTKSVTFAPASQLEQVKVISPVQSPDWASTGANSYEEEDEPYDGLADSDTLDEVSPTDGEDMLPEPSEAPTPAFSLHPQDSLKVRASAELRNSVNSDSSEKEDSNSTALGSQDLTTTSMQGFGFQPNSMTSAPDTEMHEEPSSVSDDPEQAAAELAGVWDFSGFDAGKLTLDVAEDGKSLTGTLQGKRSGNVAGSCHMGHVYKGATRKEDLCVRLMLRANNSAFRGWYFQKTDPIGGVWDAKLKPDATVTAPFQGEWSVKDLGEDVEVGLRLESTDGNVNGELIIPGEEGGVRLLGKKPALLPVASLTLDGLEMLVFLDKVPFQKDRLHLWVAHDASSALGDLFAANRPAPDMDFIP